MLLADVVATSDAVAATRGRGAKVRALADLLRAVPPGEVEPAVGFLTGEPRQGRIGVGWATVFGMDAAGAAEASVTVADLDRAIDLVRVTTGSGSSAGRRGILGDLFGRLTHREADFVRRLFVGELRQGALDGLMADAVALAAGVPAASVRRAAMLSGDLRRSAAVALADGIEGLDAIGLTVLRPVLPMLASTSATVAEAIAATGPASVSWKLDGARIQVHRAGDLVRVFTRNLNDVTARLPVVTAIVGALPVRSVVLDGEAIGLGPDGRPHPFQDTMSRFGTEELPGGQEVTAVPLSGFFFDCLHVDGRDLIDEPLHARLDALEAAAPDHRVPAIVTGEPDEAEAFLHRALAAGHEGVMVKALGAPYEAGRRGSAWRKVKPVRTLDLVVLGAEWGHGRRQGWLSNLHLGARDPAGGFVMVGKTFKGLTDQLLLWQTGKLLELESRREGITVFVRPELVVEIALDGVQASPRYPGGVALRLARVKGYRPDKAPADADTIEAVRAMLPGR